MNEDATKRIQFANNPEFQDNIDSRRRRRKPRRIRNGRERIRLGIKHLHAVPFGMEDLHYEGFNIGDTLSYKRHPETRMCLLWFYLLTRMKALLDHQESHFLLRFRVVLRGASVDRFLSGFLSRVGAIIYETVLAEA